MVGELAQGGGGVPARGCIYLGEVPAQVLPLWTEFLTHATENITLPQTSLADEYNTVQQIKQKEDVCNAKSWVGV